LRYDEEYSRVEFWLQSIQTRAKKAPIIILGTHADDKLCTPEYIETALNKVKDKYQQRFPDIRAYIAADVTRNVKDIKARVKDIISKMDTMGELMPLTYVELEKLVIAERAERKESGSPIISWKDFIRLGHIASIHPSRC
jgi:hypothetical protein